MTSRSTTVSAPASASRARNRPWGLRFARRRPGIGIACLPGPAELQPQQILVQAVGSKCKSAKKADFTQSAINAVIPSPANSGVNYQYSLGVDVYNLRNGRDRFGLKAVEE